MNAFRELSISEMEFNPFTRIGNDWLLLTAGDKENFNTMTASWGGVGVLWNKNVVFSFIRPQRYTFAFFERSNFFTASFFGPEYKKALSFCGSHSGRDVDKARETGLTPYYTDGTTTFEQARLVFVCRKLSAQFLDPGSFIDAGIASHYVNGDYHKMFIGEIVKILVKE